MSIPYNINPVKATCMKYDCTDHGIQGINDTCFGICASYSGTYDTYDMDPKCSKACTELVEQRKKEIFGVGSCDHQVPYRPVAWEQVPRYVPILLKKGLKPIQALNKCVKLCESSKLKEQCQEDCLVDFNAIEENINTPSMNVSSLSQSSYSSSSTYSTKELITNAIISIVVILISLCIIFYFKYKI